MFRTGSAHDNDLFKHMAMPCEKSGSMVRSVHVGAHVEL